MSQVAPSDGSYLGTLFFADFAEIPNVQSAIGAGRRQDGFVMRRPLHLEYFVFVRFERVKFEFEIAQIPESDSFVRGSGGQNKLGVRVEGETVDLGRVGVDDV